MKSFFASFITPVSAPGTTEPAPATPAGLDFLAVGDTVVDEFITLKDARVSCDIDDENCTISMRWGDKIPFEKAELVAGVGNSPNAAVAAARLGLSSGIITNLGADRYGDEVMEVFAREGLDTSQVARHEGIPTNHHYVLSFESERTILVKHEHYSYTFPKNLPAPRVMYLSSIGEVEDSYYDAIAAYAEAHPDMLLAFQPGTFQMQMGAERLARIWKRADISFCNKEEAARILGRSGDIKELLTGMHGLGPKTAVITDGPDGAYAYDGTDMLRVPMYPDQSPPKERTGAGDAFSSTTAAALSLGKPLREALRWGPVNSMSVVQEVGAQRGLLSRQKLEAYVADAPSEYTVSLL